LNNFYFQTFEGEFKKTSEGSRISALKLFSFNKLNLSKLSSIFLLPESFETKLNVKLIFKFEPGKLIIEFSFKILLEKKN
jgi:hypothetical protein